MGNKLGVALGTATVRNRKEKKHKENVEAVPRKRLRVPVEEHSLGEVLPHQYQVEKWDPEVDGELTVDTMAAKLEAQGYVLQLRKLVAGTHLPPHIHDEVKKDAIVTGMMKIQIEDKEYLLKAGDMLEIPKGVLHSNDVVGSDRVLFFDATKCGNSLPALFYYGNLFRK